MHLLHEPYLVFNPKVLVLCFPQVLQLILVRNAFYSYTYSKI